MRFERLLHETIDEMAGEVHAPGAGLAARSMAKGRRIRRTRRLAVGAAAAVAVAAVAVPWLALPHRDGAAPVVPAASVTASRQASPAATLAWGSGLPGGWVVTKIGDRVLDRATGELVATSGVVWPAPAGKRVLTVVAPEKVRISDVRGANPVTVDTAGFVGDYSWNAIGDRLVGGISQKEPFQVGFAVIDAGTGEVRRHWIDHDRYDCSECTFTWTRDGGGVTLPIADRSGGEAEERVDHLQYFDATSGEARSFAQVPAMPSGPFSWSPGGRYVVAGPPVPEASAGWRRFDTTTGQSVPFPGPAVWVTADVLLAVRDGKVLVVTPDGTVTATLDVPGAEPGTAISIGPPG
ncbi:hypothetical protein ACQEVZ_12655 [Dactylosporangium sp. CA-152071]|uniref:hypothetical protein n=1 Tax=Dactylosporangium sp. CA-152071 TaxID=3239933 RepID=UPI003D8F9D35